MTQLINITTTTTVIFDNALKSIIDSHYTRWNCLMNLIHKLGGNKPLLSNEELATPESVKTRLESLAINDKFPLKVFERLTVKLGKAELYRARMGEDLVMNLKTTSGQDMHVSCLLTDEFKTLQIPDAFGNVDSLWCHLNLSFIKHSNIDIQALRRVLDTVTDSGECAMCNSTIESFVKLVQMDLAQKSVSIHIKLAFTKLVESYYGALLQQLKGESTHEVQA